MWPPAPRTAQPVGGAVGLALLGTVALDGRREQRQDSGRARGGGQAIAEAGRPPAYVHLRSRPNGRLFRAFLVAAGIGLLALLIAIATIRVSRQELAGAGPEPQRPAPQPRQPVPAAAQPRDCAA